MNLADRVAQCRSPFQVQDDAGRIWSLNNTAECAETVARCPLRYVLADELTRLCADLAFSRGARGLACSDLLHMPATAFWVEWCNRPWQASLRHYGFAQLDSCDGSTGRRGALIQASRNGRRGLVRTIWTTGEADGEVVTSNLEAYFDFDTGEAEAPEPPDRDAGAASMQVRDYTRLLQRDVLARCFRFRYERSWSQYYERAHLTGPQRVALWKCSLGTIAMDIPMLVAFILLLSTRSSLPQRASDLARLNRVRHKCGKHALLEHIEVRAPVLPEYSKPSRGEPVGARRRPRLHHVRGHLVRRGDQLFWRVPHLRGSARSGRVSTRTVVWTFDAAVTNTLTSSTRVSQAVRARQGFK